MTSKGEVEKGFFMEYVKYINSVIISGACLLAGCSSMNDRIKNNEQAKFSWEYKIPQLNNISIDGDNQDWNNQGLEFDLSSNKQGVLQISETFNPSVKMVWNEKGIFLGFNVKTDAFSANHKQPWQGDSIEIFIANGINGLNHIQFAIPAEFDKENKINNVYIVDSRGERNLLANKLKYSTKGKKTKEGYFIEFFLPFDTINVKPIINESLALNLIINHLDKNNKVKKVSWHSIGGSSQLSTRRFMNKIVLSEKKGTLPQIEVKHYIEDNKMLKILLLSKKCNIGKKIVIKKENIIKKSLVIEEGNLNSDFSFNLPRTINQYGKYKIYLDNKLIKEIDELENNFYFTGTMKFLNKVNTYLADDIAMPFAKNGVVFTGHSQIDFWDQIHDDMKPFKFLNRGLGGANSDTILKYLDDLVLKHKPSMVIYYIGGNDFSAKKTAVEVVNNVKMFCERIHKELPNTQIALISSPRKPYSFNEEKKHKFCKLINEGQNKLAKEKDYVSYIDIEPYLMIDSKIPMNYFKLDGVHYNAKGYKQFAPIINSFIKENKAFSEEPEDEN